MWRMALVMRHFLTGEAGGLGPPDPPKVFLTKRRGERALD